MAEQRLDYVVLTPIFTGMAQIQCPACEQLSDTISVGTTVLVDGDDVEMIGVVNLEQCGCVHACPHLVKRVGIILMNYETRTLTAEDLGNLFEHVD